jgi:GTP-binding protein
MSAKLPSVVIAGRPNVGKSTLFNRLTGTRRSIVTDEPGITRDRIYGTVTWLGRSFELVDTGGLIPDDDALIPREILRQAGVAIESADLLILVVDARTGLTPLDEELARLLRTSGKPLIVAANKVDTGQQGAMTAPFYEIGVPVFGVSAEHGTGIDDLLDYVLEKTQSGAEEAQPVAGEEVPVRVAIIGRPNVGKSTLLNQLAGEERSIVSPNAGTTRDTVDTFVRHDGKLYEFIDTAGIRRKGKTTLVAEKLSVVMARKSLERADVALLVVDAELGITAGDAAIAGYAAESGCSVILVMNKWDLALSAARKTSEDVKAQSSNEMRVSSRKEALREKTKGPRDKKARPRTIVESDRERSLRALTDPALLMTQYDLLVRAKLKFLSFAPIVYLSALDGARMPELYPMIDHAAEGRRKRISTGELNRWLATVDLDRGTSPANSKIKIYYITQASSKPPTFVLFTNQGQRLHFSYERFLENRLREKFDFTAAPIRFLQRTKERREFHKPSAPEKRGRTSHGGPKYTRR